MTQTSEFDKLTIRGNTSTLTGNYQELSAIAAASSEIIDRTLLARKFMECSMATGNYVKILPEMSYMPVIIGNDHQPVYLYQLVEMIEGFLDYDALLDEFPTLNFSQISGAISFLRKAAQMNARGIDVDQLEDQMDEGFINALRQAYHERENSSYVFADNF